MVEAVSPEFLEATASVLHAREVGDEVAQSRFDRGGTGTAGALLASLLDKGFNSGLQQSLSPPTQAGLELRMALADRRAENLPGVFHGVVEVANLQTPSVGI